MRVASLIFLMSTLFLAACGPPNPGDSCKNDLELTCFGTYSVLECRGGIWAKIPCFGAYGCLRLSGSAFCDYVGGRPGDLCPMNLSGVFAFCYDVNSMLQCQGGVLVQVACTGCCQ